MSETIKMKLRSILLLFLPYTISHACWIDAPFYLSQDGLTLIRRCSEQNLTSQTVDTVVYSGNVYVALASDCGNSPQWETVDWKRRIQDSQGLQSPNVPCNTSTCCMMIECVSSEGCSGQYTYRTKRSDQHVAMYEPEACVRDQTQLYVEPGQMRAWNCSGMLNRTITAEIKMLSPKTSGNIQTDEMVYPIKGVELKHPINLPTVNCDPARNCSLKFHCEATSQQTCVFWIHGAMVPQHLHVGVESITGEEFCGSNCRVSLWWIWSLVGFAGTWVFIRLFRLVYLRRRKR